MWALLLINILGNTESWKAKRFQETSSEIRYSRESAENAMLASHDQTDGGIILSFTKDGGKTFTKNPDIRLGAIPHFIYPIGDNQYLYSLTNGQGIWIASEKGAPKKLMRRNAQPLGYAKGHVLMMSEGDLIVNITAKSFERWEILSLGTDLYYAAMNSVGKIIAATEKGTMELDVVERKTNLISKQIPPGNTVIAVGDEFLSYGPQKMFHLKEKEWQETSLGRFSSGQMPGNSANVFHTPEGQWIAIKGEKGSLSQETLFPLASTSHFVVSSYIKDGLYHVLLNDGTLHYQRNPLAVKITINGGGSVTVRPSETPARFIRIRKTKVIDKDFFDDSNLNLEALPDEGFKFVGWKKKDADAGKTEKLSVKLESDIEITAEFTKK